MRLRGMARRSENPVATSLLDLVCFAHADNLGAYSIPSETSFLIPADSVNYSAIRKITFGIV
jgi:hypothetical protein